MIDNNTRQVEGLTTVGLLSRGFALICVGTAHGTMCPLYYRSAHEDSVSSQLPHVLAIGAAAAAGH